MITTEEEAQRILRPLHPIIAGAFEAARITYYEAIAPHYWSPNKTMRANNISNLTCQLIAQKSEDMPGVHPFQHYGRTRLVVHDEIVLRFKKLNSRLLSSNIQTRLALDFEEQQQVIPGIGDQTNLTAGYVLDEITNEIDVYITCPMGQVNAWNYPIKKTQRVYNFANESLEHMRAIAAGDSR